MNAIELTLDAAWTQAESALPPGWYIHALACRPGLSEAERWEGSARGAHKGERVYVYGRTPGQALERIALWFLSGEGRE